MGSIFCIWAKNNNTYIFYKKIFPKSASPTRLPYCFGRNGSKLHEDKIALVHKIGDWATFVGQF